MLTFSGFRFVLVHDNTISCIYIYICVYISCSHTTSYFSSASTTKYFQFHHLHHTYMAMIHLMHTLPSCMCFVGKQYDLTHIYIYTYIYRCYCIVHYCVQFIWSLQVKLTTIYTNGSMNVDLRLWCIGVSHLYLFMMH